MAAVRCDLTRHRETVSFEGDGGTLDPVDVSTTEAIEAFRELCSRAAAAGIRMDDDVIAITPIKPLAEAIRHALTQSVAEEA
ncbi:MULTISPECIES: hypothetical protein [unclassified Micromonospora]|uniref:hypothetical protein n=1 Tax=unclassified Micromonospora TaxID=2617518 RepID=UPI003A8540F4